ncbi:MAG: sensor histidine kinase [Anaerolineales bacterium]
MNKLRTFFRQGDLTERPFFYLLTLFLVGIYIVSLVENPALGGLWMVIPTTILLVIHITLYWAAELVDKHPRWLPWYLFIQGLLAFSIAYLAANLAMIICLYAALIGIAIGMLGSSRWVIAAIAYILVLSLINYSLLYGPQSFPSWAVATIPVMVFVVIYVVLYTRQAQARVQAQSLLDELEIANRQLSEYAAQVEDLTIASERQRMARELHDTLSQGLAGVILQLEAADAHLSNNRPERAQAILQQTMSQARATLSEARRAIGDLRQDRTEPADLIESLREEVEHFTRATGIPCDLALELPSPIPAELSEPALRTVSEALSNVARHAQAGKAIVRLVTADGQLRVEVRDDGCGFDPLSVKQGHYGLLGMSERARLAGGRMEINSKPGEGTLIVLRLPLSPEAEVVERG